MKNIALFGMTASSRSRKRVDRTRAAGVSVLISVIEFEIDAREPRKAFGRLGLQEWRAPSVSCRSCDEEPATLEAHRREHGF